MPIQEMTYERRQVYLTTFFEKHDKNYFQRKNIIYRNMKNGNMPTNRVIEKYKLTPDELSVLFENSKNKLRI